MIDGGNMIHTSVQGTDKKSIPLQFKTWHKVVIRQKPSGTGKVKWFINPCSLLFIDQHYNPVMITY